MTEKIEDLIAEAREWPLDRINEGWLINALADALEAATRERDAVPDAATEAKQPEGWSTEDHQESKQEAERRWVDERSGYKSDYNRGCINGFILGAEWQKARPVGGVR